MSQLRPESWRHELLVQLPSTSRTPVRALLRRSLLAFALWLLTAGIVYLDRDGYRDNINHDGLGVIDCLYFATVTLTTAGDGGISPFSPQARFLMAFVITPLRIVFIVLLVATAIELLAVDGRRAFRDMHWRRNMRAHTVVIGYGTKGRSAVQSLLASGTRSEKVLVVDDREQAISEANRVGLAGIVGDGKKRETLLRAEIVKARQIIITLDRDDAAILSTLMVRQLNPAAHVVVAVQDENNVSLVRQSGASIVVTSSDAVGRLMGLSSLSPTLGKVVEDLLSSGEGIELAQRLVDPSEVGHSPADIVQERVIAVVRRDKVRRFFDASVQTLETGDELIIVRRSESDAKAEREARIGT